MNSVLLDTNIVIDFFHGKEEVVALLSERLSEGLVVSTISLAELYHGAQKSNKALINLKKIESFSQIPEVTILSFNKQTARYYGKLFAKLEASGMVLAEVDTMIASQALQHNLPILTQDKKHFTRLQEFELNVEIM